jgi:hypothetical protein
MILSTTKGSVALLIVSVRSIRPSVVVLSVIMLSVSIQSVVMLSVVAPLVPVFKQELKC